MMPALRVTVTLLCLVAFGVSVGCNAVTLEMSGAIPVMAERALRKPVALTKLSDDAFCFLSSDASCASHTCPETLLCSLDFGASFVDAPFTLPFCGPQGVLVGDQLLCPAELLPRAHTTEVAFSVNAFHVDGGAFAETISADKQFVFHHDTAITTVQFTGTALYIASEDQYFMVATMVEEEEERRVTVLLVSEDGLAWETKSRIPLEGEQFFFATNAAGNVFVFARTGDSYRVVTSKYTGKWWSNPHELNTTVPPFMLPLPASGVTLEYSTDNSTQHLQLAYGTGLPKNEPRVRLARSVIAEDVCSSSSNYATGAVTNRNGAKTLVMLHDCDGQLHASTYVVDDSAEEEKKAKEEVARKEKVAAAEEAKRKAKAKKLEQQQRERRDRRRKELERQAQFLEEDATCWQEAADHFKEDGEWIVVRKVRKETADLEKKTFFQDMHL